MQIVRAIESGESPDKVAEIFGVGRESVFRYWRDYRALGLDGLNTKKTRGRPAKLTEEQLRTLFTLVEGTNPRQLSFDFGLWTRRLVRDLIWREFRVRLSEESVGRILRSLGMSPQRPLYRAYQQDPERVERWKREEYPAIRAEAAKEGAAIFFADEASVRTDYHAGTTWARVGQTPVVETTGKRNAVKMISAVSPRAELRFHFHRGSMNRWKFIDFCKQLLSVSEKKIFLIVDGSSIHKAKEMAAFVAATEGRLRLFFLPSYSPELNRVLAQPFPLTKAWLWEGDEDDPRTQEEIDAVLEQVFDHGSIVLGTDGCGMYWHLIVAGPHRGHVWNISGEGAAPFGAEFGFTTGDPGFAGWVKHWAARKALVRRRMR